MNIVNSKIPVFCSNNKNLKNIIYCDKKYYSLIKQSNYIYVYNKAFHFLSKIKLEQYYDNMTFSNKNKLFYFNSQSINNICKITITDMKFKIIKEIRYKINEYKIQSIYYSETEETIYIITNNSIFKINEYGKIISILNKNQINDNIQTPEKTISKISTAFIEKDMYVCYCKESKNYIAKLKNANITEEYFIDSDVNINNIINYENDLYLFGNDKYNYIYETGISIDITNETRKNGNELDKNSNIIQNNKYNNYYNLNYSNCCISQKIKSIALEQNRNRKYFTK